MSAPDWSKGAAWMRGQVVPIGEATIGVTDWGLTRSDVTYDVVSVRSGAFFRLPEHLARFRASMAALRLDPGLDDGAIRSALHAIVARSGLREAYVAMVASRGVPLVPGVRDPRRCANHFFAWCVPYLSAVPEAVGGGASARIARGVRRIPPESVDPTVKNYHWGDFTRGLFEAKDLGFDTVILLGIDGNVAEGPGFNVFAVVGGRVVTPQAGCLEGVTRRTVLEICGELGIPAEVRPLPPAELLAADEVFLSSTAGGVLPVTRLDERILGNGAPGPVSRRIAQAYDEWTRRPVYRDEVDYGEENGRSGVA